MESPIKFSNINLTEEIIESMITNGLNSNTIIIDKNKQKIIVDEIKAKFVLGNPSVLWNSFLYPKTVLEYETLEDIEIYLYSIFGENSEVFLLTENDILLHIHTKFIFKIIANCSYFEYYIIDKNITKILCETDHNELIFTELQNLTTD